MLLGKGMSDSQRYVLIYRIRKKLIALKDEIPLLWDKFAKELILIHDRIAEGLNLNTNVKPLNTKVNFMPRAGLEPATVRSSASPSNK